MPKSKPRTRSTTLFTIGYQGHDLEEFAWLVGRNGATVLIDVRHSARSRNHDFDKNALKSGLQREKIRYEHMPELGSPPELRKELYETGDLDAFDRSYREHAQEQQDALERLYGMITDDTCCLMCMEKDARTCHRTILVAILRQRNGRHIEIVNL